VAQRYFPSATKREALWIAGVAMLTVGYLTTIVHIRKRVDFLAGRNSDLSETVLIEKVLAEYIAKLLKPCPCKPAPQGLQCPCRHQATVLLPFQFAPMHLCRGIESLN